MIGPTKTRASRTIRLPAFLRDMLSEHLALHQGPEGLLFGGPEDGPLRPRNFRARVWELAVETSGLAPLRIHDLRHTCAALLVAQGAHVKQIADRLGHSSPVVTMKTYAHILPSLEEELADGLEDAYQKASARAAAPSLPPRRPADVVALPSTEDQQRT
jgi:integrase